MEYSESPMENMVGMNTELSKFKNKRIFITGHTGFKGAWLTTCLHLLGGKLKGYSLAPEYEKGLFSIIEPRGIIDSVIGDIRNKENLIDHILNFEPDFIFHLAAQPLVRRSYTIPSETFDINVTGTANVLEAVIKLKKKCTVVLVTTDKVYHNFERNVLYNENDRLGGYDPYSASKACAELVIDSFRNSFFNLSSIEEHKKAIASARAGNVIGGGDWSEDRIIPDIIRSFEKNNPIKIRNPHSVRPWQHVLEPIIGYLRLGVLLDENPMKYSKAYNFGPRPSDHLTVKELVELAIRTWGSGSWVDQSGPGRFHEAALLKLDISLAEKEIEWVPKLTASEAIDWTITWYKESESRKLDLTCTQINNYLSN